VNPGTWSGTLPITYSYQWQRCDTTGQGCVAVTGATGSTYLVTTADAGYTLKVVVTATNQAGSQAASATANPVASVPPVTTGLQLWFEAASESYTEGQSAQFWHDRSGFARDLSAWTSSDAPLFRSSGVNGKPALEFNGVNSLMKTYASTFSISQPSTFFVVYRSLDAASSTARGFVFDSTNSSIRQVFGRTGSTTLGIYGNYELDVAVTYPFPAFQIWSGTFNSSTSGLWKNGVQVVAGQAGSSAMSGLTVGALSSASIYGYDFGHFQVAEILYYAAALSDSDRQAITSWLNQKYSVF
jgi:hypothetical protein